MSVIWDFIFNIKAS